MTNQTKEELRKEFAFYMQDNDKGLPLGYIFTHIANFWLEQFDNLINEKIERIEKSRIKYPCGKYCVQEGRNEGLNEAITILKE